MIPRKLNELLDKCIEYSIYMGELRFSKEEEDILYQFLMKVRLNRPKKRLIGIKY
jgi:hypothetical protein